jgi:hypothetical protein
MLPITSSRVLGRVALTYGRASDTLLRRWISGSRFSGSKNKSRIFLNSKKVSRQDLQNPVKRQKASRQSDKIRRSDCSMASVG